MSKKKIKECTFKEFNGWCNDRACDGRWNFIDAMCCIKAIGEVNKVEPLFGRKKAREKKWEEIRGEYLNPEAEIEV